MSLIYWILILLMWYHLIPNTFSRDIKIMFGLSSNKPALYPTRLKPSQPNNKKPSKNSLSSLNLFPFYDLYILHLHHFNDTIVCITNTISCSIMRAYNKRKTRIPNQLHSQIKGECKDWFAFPLNLFLQYFIPLIFIIF